MQIRGEGTGGFAKGKALVVTAKESLFGDFPEGSILVVEGISLEDSGKMDFSNVTGIVASSGSEKSETLLLANGLGIPAVVNVPNCLESIISGDRILILGNDVHVNPDLGVVNEFQKQRKMSDPQMTFDFEDDSGQEELKLF